MRLEFRQECRGRPRQQACGRFTAVSAQAVLPPLKPGREGQRAPIRRRQGLRRRHLLRALGRWARSRCWPDRHRGTVGGRRRSGLRPSVQLDQPEQVLHRLRHACCPDCISRTSTWASRHRESRSASGTWGPTCIHRRTSLSAALASASRLTPSLTSACRLRCHAALATAERTICQVHVSPNLHVSSAASHIAVRGRICSRSVGQTSTQPGTSSSRNSASTSITGRFRPLRRR